MKKKTLVERSKSLAFHTLDQVGVELRLKSSRCLPWEDNLEFTSLYQTVADLTTLPADRCYRLWELARHVRRLPGAMAECGVYRGGSAKFLSQVLSDRRLFLFDMFDGHPSVGETIDGDWMVGDFENTSYQQVSALFHDASVSIHAGVVPGVLEHVERETFCLVHLDLDLYAPTHSALKFFYPRMVSGGCILIDDYGFPSCPGIRQAVDEFSRAQDIQPIYFLTGQCLLIPH